jgi:hypothetical protein
VRYKDADMPQDKLTFPRGMHNENDACLGSDRIGHAQRELARYPLG